MGNKSKFRNIRNSDTGLMDRNRVEQNHERKSRRNARKAARRTRIMDPNRKGVNTAAGERA